MQQILPPALCFLLIVSSPDLRSCAQDDLVRENKLGFVYHPSLFISSHANQNYRLSFQRSPSISEESTLIYFLLNERIRNELALTDEQKKSIDKFAKQLHSSQAKLISWIDALGESSEPELKKLEHDFGKWLEASKAECSGKLEGILLPHQEEVLTQIQLQYFAALFGYARLVQYCKQKEIIDIDEKSIVRLSQAESKLLQPLAKKCRDFCDSETNKVLDVLNKNQSTQVVEALEAVRLPPFPELLAGQAKLVKEGQIEKDTSRYSIWGKRLVWLLEPDGSFKVKVDDSDALAYDYLINALHKDANLKQEFAVVDYQVEQFESVIQEVNKMNEEVLVRIEDMKTNSKQYQTEIDKWKKRKQEFVSGQLDKIFVGVQRETIDKWNCLIDIRRFGIHEALANGEFGNRLGLDSKQKKKILAIAEKLPKRYAEFADETSAWYLDELLSGVNNDEDQTKIRELFDNDLKIVSLSIGCLSRALILRGGN